MDGIYIEFRYLDDPQQKFSHARFPAVPRIGDSVTTPQPQQHKYLIAEVGFECEGSRADETSVILSLRRQDTPPG
jgi:hypothetical protein